MTRYRGQLRVNRYICQIYSAYANNKFYLSTSPLYFLPLKFLIFCLHLPMTSVALMMICWWKLWQHHAALFVIYLKEFQNKDLELGEGTAWVKNLVDKGWMLEGATVEYWMVSAIHYQNIGVYNVLWTTFLFILAF